MTRPFHWKSEATRKANAERSAERMRKLHADAAAYREAKEDKP